jgi:PilZ domain-containing protein
MDQPDWLTIALGVLPELPHNATCLRDDGGQLRLSLLEIREGQLYGTMASLDAEKGLKLTIPIDRAERGGYSIGCTITEVYFLGGVESGALLQVDEVLRRKPYRLKERVTTDSTATLRVVTASQLASGTTFLGRLLDISSSGVGLSLETELAIGDRIAIDSTVHGVRVLGEAVAIKASKMAFGRWRVGCQFVGLPIHTQHRIDDLAAAEQAPAGDQAAA